MMVTPKCAEVSALNNLNNRLARGRRGLRRYTVIRSGTRDYGNFPTLDIFNSVNGKVTTFSRKAFIRIVKEFTL